MQLTSWMDLPKHQAWLESEGDRLLSFARQAKDPFVGFASLDSEGRPEPGGTIETYITCRMTHVFALAHLRGVPGAGLLADHGIAALHGRLRDAEHGGWYSAVTADGQPESTRKTAYEHAFVVLAASSATVADRPKAKDLLDEALSMVEQHFWRESEGACLESWDRGWSVAEEYRGANSNMHFVEALLAAADASGDEKWCSRALRIAERLIEYAARDNGWRLPEHFDVEWRPDLEYNSQEKSHPFRPYGSTIGHWLEWSRLLLHLEAGLAEAPRWLLEDARMLFEAAQQAGWAVDGADGFVYTVDWDSRPVVRLRMHWVVAEAIAAAAVLYRRTGEWTYERWYREWWDYASEYLIDYRRGSWHHELGPDNKPSALVWPGKPDVYHALQATLLPQLPIGRSLAGALVRRQPEP